MLFADGTAARSLHQAGDCTTGFPGAARLCPASSKESVYRTCPDCQDLLPLLEVIPDPHQLRMWGADFRGAELICTRLRLELGSANTHPRWAGSKVTRDCGMGGHSQRDSSMEEVQGSWTLWHS